MATVYRHSNGQYDRRNEYEVNGYDVDTAVEIVKGDETMKHEEITNEQFDNELARILRGMTGEQLLHIPGIYEIVSEELNNQIIDNLCGE